MKRLLTLSLLLILAVASAMAADVTGDWKFTALTPNGDQVYATFKLKSEGAKLSGTIEAEFPGKATIDDGSLEGENIKMKITVKNDDGRSIAYQLSGTTDGAEMKGIIEAEVDGEKIKLTWSAKKS